MPRGQKTPPEVVYKIIASWAITDNYHKTSRDLNIPFSTVKDVVEKNKDVPEFAQLRLEIREEFSNSAARVIKKTMSRIEREIDNSEKEIPVNQLVSIIDKLYDKKALADGTSTDNVTVNIKLPEGIDEYAG